MSEEKIVDDVFSLCNTKINERFNLFSKLKECEIISVSASEVLDNIDHRSEILLYGTSITVRIQFFYNCEVFKTILAHLYDDAGKERVVDFFNEVGNLTGGKVKEVLMGHGVVTALSLPMSIATNKTKSITATEVLPKSRYFQIRFNDNNIFSSKVSFEIHDQRKFNNFDKDYLKSDFKDGDVDFF